jgi:very-short-patch-repair endonuclease
MQPGSVYNQWEVICKESYAKVLCRCVCGTEKYVRASYLKRGQSKSCGCMNNYYKQQTSLNKFGSSWATQSKELREKIGSTKRSRSLEEKAQITEKRKKTNTEKYGVAIPNVDKSALKTRKQILKGTRFGYLEVVEDRNGSKDLKVCCLACSSEVFEKPYNLLRWGSENQSCGCLTKKVRVKKCLEAKNLKQYKKGTIFGYWELVEDYKPNRKQLTKVKCTACNQVEKELALFDLIDSRTKSCGCKKQEMIEKSCLEQFGVRRALQAPEIRAKVAQTLEVNGTTKTSKQQLEIYNVLKSAGYKVVLNKPIGACNVDIFVELEQGIIVEYDGGGHFVHGDLGQIRKKDYARDMVMIHKFGYKVLRVESMKDVVPTLEDLVNKINLLCNTERNFAQLKMS